MEEICYKNNYLSDVIVRMDFANPLSSLLTPVLPDPIKDSIRAIFKIYEPGKEVVQTVEVQNETVKTSMNEIHQWIFHSEDRSKTIIISQNYLTIQYKKYRSFNEFREDISSPLNELIKLERNIPINRTGLRFINIFDTIKSYEDINNYFSPMIANTFNALIDRDFCSRNFLISEFLYDDIKIKMQSGIYNPDYPAPIRKKDFIIDLDGYIDTPHMLTGSVEQLLIPIHEKIQHIFENSITDILRDRLNEQ